jgi:hypothetical protein
MGSHHVSPFQILAVLFCLAMIVRVVSLWRRGKRSGRELVAWIAVWGGVGFLGAWPHVADIVGGWLGLKSGANAVIFFALIVLSYLTLRSLFVIEGLEQKLSTLTRKLALEDFANVERRLPR